MKNLSTIQKQKLVSIYPELKSWLDQREQGQSNSAADSMAMALMMKVDSVKGEKGDKGDTGYTPVKGKDYWTNSEINSLIANVVKQAKPIKGKDYRDGIDGKDGKSIRGEMGERGVPGRDGSPDKPDEIASKLNTLKGAIDVSVIKGAITYKELDNKSKVLEAGMARIDGRIKLTDQRWHGGGLSKVSHDTTLSGDGTGSNPLSVVGGAGATWYQDETVASNTTGTSFSLAHTPVNIVFLFKNGQYLISGAGQDYTRSGKVLTLSVSLNSADILTANYQ